MASALIAVLISITASHQQFAPTAHAAGATPLKAVIVVGPTHDSTAKYLEYGEALAQVAESTIRYRLFRDGVRIARLTGNNYVDRPDLAGIYSYEVRAVDEAGNKSALSPPISVEAVKGPLP